VKKSLVSYCTSLTKREEAVESIVAEVCNGKLSEVVPPEWFFFQQFIYSCNPKW
jgi:hypothetical protein